MVAGSYYKLSSRRDSSMYSSEHGYIVMFTTAVLQAVFKERQQYSSEHGYIVNTFSATPTPTPIPALKIYSDSDSVSDFGSVSDSDFDFRLRPISLRITSRHMTRINLWPATSCFLDRDASNGASTLLSDQPFRRHASRYKLQKSTTIEHSPANFLLRTYILIIPIYWTLISF